MKMCAPCCGHGLAGCCNPCRMPKVEMAINWDEYRWFERCTDPKCIPCHEHKKEQHHCPCICRRNRHVVEALSCLFNTRLPFMLTMLFKLATHEPEPRVSRDRVWDVMGNVKAPYTELDDLEIYDSMYDRCGMPIDPLDHDNIYKILRMMFLSPVLTIEQQKYLLRMLQRLNAHAHSPVDIPRLMDALSKTDIKSVVCSLREQEKLCRSFYASRKCEEICSLYMRVGSVDKNVMKQRRRRLKHYGHKKTGPVDDGNANAAIRQSVLNRQFCERRPQRERENTYCGPTENTTPASTTTDNTQTKRSSANNSAGMQSPRGSPRPSTK